MKYVMFVIYWSFLFIILPIYHTNGQRNRNSKLECRLPENPPFGRYEVGGSSKNYKPEDTVQPYTILKYSCDEGYFVTSNISYCQNGVWSVKPTCQKRKIMCYYTSWATYRQDKGKFDVEDIDPNLCTHLVYAFVGLSDEPGIQIRDPWNDLYDNYGKGALSRFVKLKEQNPDLKVLLSIGGEGSEKFSQAFNTSEKRQTFVRNVVKFLRKHEFDGIEIAWEFPAHNGGVPQDKDNFVELLKVLRAAFNEHGYTLSAVVAGPENYMVAAYNVTEISKYLDIINVKAYDLHGAWDAETGIRSPLFPAVDEIGGKSHGNNVNAIIENWLKFGAPAYKLVLGMGLFGRSFNLSSTSCKLPRCPSAGSGAPGQWTNEAGRLGFNEVCLLEKDKSTVKNFDKEAVAPFLYKGNMWVGYDDKQSLEQKINYIIYNKLGGASLWSLDTDDFNGDCGDGEFPLTSFTHRTLVAGKPTAPMPKPYQQERMKPKRRKSERVLFCYYASWSVYRKDDGKFDVEDIDPDLCTHIVFTFVGLTDEIGIRVRDAWNDLFDNYGRGALSRFTKLKNANPNLVTLLAIGGYGEPSEKFSRSVDTPQKRSLFVQNSLAFLLKFGFDGLDIVWEFPGQRGGRRTDKANYGKLLKALREEYNKHGLLLTALAASTQVTPSESYDFKAMEQYLDYVGIKTFDMHGHWNSVTGHNSPLFRNKNDRVTVDASLRTWINSGISSQKLLMGIATYGRSFTLKSTTCSTLGCSTTSGGTAGNLTNEAGLLGYNEICLLERDPDSTSSFDVFAKVPYLQKGDQWISYDNKKSIEDKVEYIKSNNLGGALVWTLDTDDFKGACGEGKFPITRALRSAFDAEEFSQTNDTSCDPKKKQCSTPQPPIIIATTTTTEAPAVITQATPQAAGCPLPEFPLGGQYEVANYQKKIVVGDLVPPYTLLSFSCKKNYVPSARIAFCQEDFTWSASPDCNRRCRMPVSYTVDFFCLDSTQNTVNCEDFVDSGTVVRYQCKFYHYNSNFYNYHMTCDDGVFDYPPPRCAPECGVEPSEGVAYVIDGIEARRGTFPWHVAIYEDRGNPPNGDYEQICGGSLITTHIVLSAAHCFYVSSLKRAKDPSIYAVGVGKFVRDWNDANENENPYIQKSMVKNIFIPVTYGGDALTHQSDIAILELATQIKLSDAVHPVCVNLNNDELNRHQISSNSLGKVAGWGLTTEEGSTSKELKYLNVPVIDYPKCRDEMEKYNFGKYITLDKICAGYTNGSALCRGDSGGGLVFPHRDPTESVKRWYIRGIVSVGPKNNAQSSCRRDTYTAYTQVHYFKDWISRKFVELKF